MIFWLLAADTAEAAEEAPNPLIPEPVELIVGALAFLVVFAILWRFAFPALNRVLAERTEKIQGNLEKAEHARSEADQELARYREQLAGATKRTGSSMRPGRRPTSCAGICRPRPSRSPPRRSLVPRRRSAPSATGSSRSSARRSGRSPSSSRAASSASRSTRRRTSA